MSTDQPKPDPVKRPGEPVHRVDRAAAGLDGAELMPQQSVPAESNPSVPAPSAPAQPQPVQPQSGPPQSAKAVSPPVPKP